MLNPRIGGTNARIEPAQQRDLICGGQTRDWIEWTVAWRDRGGGDYTDRLTVIRGSNCARCLGGFEQRRQGQIIGIGKARFLARDCTQTNPLIERMRTLFDQAVFQAPRFAARIFEVEISQIDLAPAHAAQHLLQRRNIKSSGREELFLRD